MRPMKRAIGFASATPTRNGMSDVSIAHVDLKSREKSERGAGPREAGPVILDTTADTAIRLTSSSSSTEFLHFSDIIL